MQFIATVDICWLALKTVSDTFKRNRITMRDFASFMWNASSGSNSSSTGFLSKYLPMNGRTDRETERQTDQETDRQGDIATASEGVSQA